MKDKKLEGAIARLDAIGPQPATATNRRLRAKLLAQVIDGIRERGGTFRWVGWEYFEHPTGQLDQRLPQGARGPT
jgi:hypothetical protein